MKNRPHPSALKKRLSFILLLCAVFLSACGAQTYTFTVIDGGREEAVEMSEGQVLEGGALVYTQAGQVFSCNNYEVCERLYGVIADPPELTLMDVYPSVSELLDNGEKVLVIYIDGLGWDIFQAALADGDAPCLSALSCRKAASMYPTITPVNYAAMVTGAPPAVNGVSARGIHSIACPTIFDYAADLGLASFVSEGDTQILALPSADMELSPDLNGSGTGDDEIFDCAMEALEDYPLVFVHFHSVDDAEHQYGPGAPEARQALKDVDSWCGELISAWDGRVIVTADHGQHENDGSGDAAYADRSGTHGDFAVSDIFVPFMTD